MPNNAPQSKPILNNCREFSVTIDPIINHTPHAQAVEKMKDSASMADEIISQNNNIKIVPSNSVIEVDLDELLDRKQSDEKSN